MSGVTRSARILSAISVCLLVSLVSELSYADEAVKLSDVWNPGPNGVIIQLPRAAKLIVDPAKDGKPYVLKGKRLVIRAASIELASAVTITSWNDADVPAKRKSFDTAAPPGPNGADCDRACIGGAGERGKPGSDGATGDSGFNAGSIVLNVGAINGLGSLVIDGRGGKGGAGQDGQQGGKGGRSGRGGDADTDKVGICKKSGGDAGPAGSGGEGGKGGRGGSGGAGASFRISKSMDDMSSKVADADAVPMPIPGKLILIYAGGLGGMPGSGGPGGDGGDPNDGGSGKGTCTGGHGARKGPTPPKQTQNFGSGPIGPQGKVVISN